MDATRLATISCWRTYVEFAWEGGVCIYPYAGITSLSSQVIDVGDGMRDVLVAVNGDAYQTTLDGYEDLHRYYVNFMERVGA